MAGNERGEEESTGWEENERREVERMVGEAICRKREDENLRKKHYYYYHHLH